MLVRFAFLRALGLLCAVVFAGHLWHVAPLWGSGGLTPAAAFLDRVALALGDEAAWRVPTLFWLSASDAVLHGAAALGLLLSLALALGLANAPLVAALWLLHLSFVGVGQVWLGYGWDILLLELLFLTTFLVPAWDPRPLSPRPVPRAVVWLLRWTLFRLYLGAGLIKVRGDPCWTELTCLDHHFETQPNPHPLSWLWHHLPEPVLAGGVVANHLVELVVPFLLLAPPRLRRVGVAAMAAFQVALILSGNLAWLNHATLVLCIVGLDDGLLARVLPRRLVARGVRAAAATPSLGPVRFAVTGLLCVLVGLLSLQPAANLLSLDQAMNRAYDPLKLVNSYGAFGSVGTERSELLWEGTADDPADPDAAWLPYAFPCKPTDPDRAPCFVTPWHPRLDWQLWFAAMQTPDTAPWTVHLAWQLASGEGEARRLLADDPFPDRPPRAVRVQIAPYRFTDPGEEGWWMRGEVRPWLGPVTAEDPRVLAFLERRGWR